MALTCTDSSTGTKDLHFSLLFHLLSSLSLSSRCVFIWLPFTELAVLQLSFYFLLLHFYYYPNAWGYNFVAKMFYEYVSSSLPSWSPALLSFLEAMKCMRYAREIPCFFVLYVGSNKRMIWPQPLVHTQTHTDSHLLAHMCVNIHICKTFAHTTCPPSVWVRVFM